MNPNGTIIGASTAFGAFILTLTCFTIDVLDLSIISHMIPVLFAPIGGGVFMYGFLTCLKKIIKGK